MYKRIITSIAFMTIFCATHAQMEIPLKPYFRTLKKVSVEINNKSYSMLFDTGAGITLVSPEIAKELNRPVYGNTVGFRMSGEKVKMKLCDSIDMKMGGISFHHPHVGVFDMMSLLPKELERIDGIISLKTFKNNNITLNLSENKVIVETEDSFKEKIKNMELVPSRFVNAYNGRELDILVGVNAYAHLWWFLFDSGNISKVKISKNIAPDWSLSCKEDEVTGIGNYTFEIAGDSITAPTIIDDIIYDGALSFDFIQQSVYAISFKDKKIWIAKSDHDDK